jgi:hypothetical protein
VTTAHLHHGGVGGGCLDGRSEGGFSPQTAVVVRPEYIAADMRGRPDVYISDSLAAENRED